MVEIVRVRHVRFRRHLAMCVLVVMLNEVTIDLLGTGVGKILAGGRTWTTTTGAVGDQNEQVARLPSSLRAVRIRMASAHETEMASSGAGDATANTQRIYQYDTNDDLNFLARAFATFQDSLPVIDLNISLAPAQARRFEFGQLDAEIDDYYNEQFPVNMSLEQLQLMSVKAALRTAPIPLHTSWGYETRELMRLGSLPVRDDELCAAQLAHLTRRLELALREGQARADREDLQEGPTTTTPAENFESRQVYKTSDLELMRYLDTFGRAPADLLRGNVRWYGSRQACLRTRLRPLEGARHASGQQQQQRPQELAIKFRYCLAAYRSLGWPRPRAGQLGSGISGSEDEPANKSHWIDYGVSSSDFNLGNVFLRVGVCLPEACDSGAIGRPENTRAIERLMRFNLAKPFNSDHYKLADLYCQPDSRSPLRSIPLAGKLLLGLACGWLLLVAAATFVHLNVDKFYIKTVELIDRQRRVNLSSGAQKRERLEPDSDEKNDELKESDILNLKLKWIKLNISLRERARHIIAGVDLIDCLSLYSNWLKYTRRVKLAIVRLHEEEQELEHRRRANEQLVANGGIVGVTKGATPTFGNARLSNGINSSVERGVETKPTSEKSELDGRTGNGQTQAEDGGDDDHLKRQQSSWPNKRPVASSAATNRVDTTSLNAFKVIALVWIIAGHCIFYLGSAISNGALLKDYFSTLPAFALSNGAIYITELFFVITGCLTAHLVFKHTTRVGVSTDKRNTPGDQIELSERSMASDKNNNNNNNNTFANAREEEEATAGAHNQSCHMERRLFGAPFWLLVALNRYLRIVPTYLLVYAFVKLVSVYVGGQGQLWDYAVSANSMRRACQQESWLPVLTLTTNYVDIYKHCIVGGWYLSADMQFSLMAIPLLLLLARCQRVRVPVPSNVCASGASNTSAGKFLARVNNKRLLLAYALIVATALISMLVSIAATVLQSQVDMSYIIKFSPHTIAILSQNIAMYTNSVFRFRAFALGLILGHLLYLYEFRLITLPRFVRLHGAKLAVVIFSCGFCVMFAPVLYPMGKLRMSHDMTATLTIVSAAGIDLFLCALIFLICINKAPKLVLFLLNSPFWSLLSSLSLCAFLVHTEVIVVLTSLLDPPPNVSYGLLLFVFSATLLLTYTLALGLYLSFEMPVSRLIEAFMRSFIFMDERMKISKTQASNGGVNLNQSHPY